MSTSTSKRARREDDIGDDKPKESSGTSSQEILGNGDTEIFSTLIPLMEDLDVLKTCRLVCKSWNEFACQALMKLPWVYFSVDEFHPKKLDNCLKLLVENKNLGLPSPFANLKFTAKSFRDKIFRQILKYVRENTNDSSIQLIISSPSVDPMELQTVLTSNLNFKITELVITNRTVGGGSGASAFQPKKIQLAHLKTLRLDGDGLKTYKMATLCENLCHDSPLKALDIQNIKCIKNLEKVISSGGMKSVEKFSFSQVCHPVSPQHWKYVCARVMEIPFIKILNVCFREFDYNESYFEGFEELIERFAHSLESLTGDFLPKLKNKRFAQLREINYKRFGKFDNDFSLPVERFPRLKKVTFEVRIESPLEYPCIEEQSPGIEQLSISAESYQKRDEIMKFISAAGMVFPNITSFYVKERGEMLFSPSLLNLICKSSPKLTTLELQLDDRNGFLPHVDDWLQAGWPLEEIPRHDSRPFYEFPADLEKLTLGHFFLISKDLFTRRLSGIPKLQHLTFYLNNYISADDVKANLGHLKRITVVIQSAWIDPSKKLLNEMERLRQMLPGVVELTKVTHL